MTDGSDVTTDGNAQDDLRKSRAEVERLREDLTEAVAMRDHNAKVADEREAELERLREERDEAVNKADAQWSAEIERLREALTNVREWCAEQRDYCRPPDMADLDDEELDQRRGPCAAYGAVVYALVIGRIDRAEQKR